MFRLLGSRNWKALSNNEFESESDQLPPDGNRRKRSSSSCRSKVQGDMNDGTAVPSPFDRRSKGLIRKTRAARTEAACAALVAETWGKGSVRWTRADPKLSAAARSQKATGQGAGLRKNILTTTAKERGKGISHLRPRPRYWSRTRRQPNREVALQCPLVGNPSEKRTKKEQGCYELGVRIREAF